MDDASANCEIIPDRVTDCRRRQWLHVNESNPKLVDLQSALAEMQRLREENVRLRCLLQEHGIQIPAAGSRGTLVNDPGLTELGTMRWV